MFFILLGAIFFVAESTLLNSALPAVYTLNLDLFSKRISLIPQLKSLSGVLNSRFIYSETLNAGESNQSTHCQRDWDTIKGYERWQVPKFWDSFAQVGTGQLEGHITFLGQSEQCANVKTGFMPVTFQNFPDVKPFLVYYKKSQSDDFVFTVGVCMPAECSKREVMNLYKNYTKTELGQPPFVVGADEKPEIQMTAGAVIAWVIFGSIVLLIVVGTSISLYRDLLGYLILVFVKLESSMFSMKLNSKLKKSVLRYYKQSRQFVF